MYLTKRLVKIFFYVFTLIMVIPITTIAMPAAKNTDLSKKLVQLKASLAQLKTKLQNLNEKLNTLNEKITSPKPAYIAPKKITDKIEKEDFYTGGPGTQWTFNEKAKQLNLTTSMPGTYDQVPGIGIYDIGIPDADYTLATRIFLLELSEDMLNKAPKSIVDQLKQHSEYKKKFFYINVVTGISDNPYSKPYNMIFHGFLAFNALSDAQKKDLFDSPGKALSNVFNVRAMVPMGIFEQNGLIKIAHKETYPPETRYGGYRAYDKPILFDELTEISVNYHDMRFSPDNAHIRINPERNISTFWSIALTPDKLEDSNDKSMDAWKALSPEDRTARKVACVTFNLLINDKGLAGKIEEILSGNNFEDILKHLVDFKGLSEEDSDALKGFVATINRLRSN